MSANIEVSITLYEPVEIDPTTTGFKIRQRRNELGWSANQLASKVSCSKCPILKAENGQSLLSFNNYNEVCGVLGLDPRAIADKHYIAAYYNE